MFSPLRRGPGRPTSQQARQRTGDGGAVLLDVRESPERKARYAPGPPHLPLSRPTAGPPLRAAARGKPVAAVCRSGRRSGRHSQQAAGLPAGRDAEAADVTGGMAARARAGLPVTGRVGRGGVVA
ncbi:rhodanese-like domain-containing protein [Streptomyces lycii]|uniref:Rhodanese-like domain-containing protein n=1 Tax=Streptomyces lycii TaxID=2654337 RepID=A0ABQ7FMW9_9ACTN|nr:rhodanese-like domain-containing protein [Streptomyces lycii]KAF4408593.1 rhodanese-like domain-containing protein [Streptomyces lycii]